MNPIEPPCAQRPATHPRRRDGADPSRRGLVLWTCVGVGLLGACRALPRADVTPEATIAETARLPAPLEFRVVGPEGAPLDESDAAPDALTLPDAIRRAVTTDPGLQAALARVRIAAADADQARMLPNPVLDVVFRAGEGRPSIEASFVQEFVQALQRPARASAADNRLRAAAADSVVVALDVIFAVQEHYIAAQSSAALLPLLEERLELVGRHVATAQSRLDFGEGTRGDVVTLRAEHVELQVSIDRARLEERTNRLRLARSIGEPSAAATWELDPWRAPDLRSQSEGAWVDAALAARPEVQSIAWQLRALGDEAGLVSMSTWEGAAAGLEAERGEGWQVGPSISVPIPIFDRGDARAAALAARQLEARHELTLARRRVVEEVRTAYHALAASSANLARMEQDLLPLQRERRQLAEDAYRAGQTDVTPLYLSEQDLRIAQTQFVEIETEAAIALVRLQRAVGGPGVAVPLGRAQPSVIGTDPPRIAVDPTRRSSQPTLPRQR